LRIFEDIETKCRFRNPVVTIGIFDGIHAGHRKILDSLQKTAARENGESIVITLWPHPRTLLQDDNNDFRLLNTLEEKKTLLSSIGVDNLIIVPFTKDLSLLEPDDFITRYLVEKIGIHTLVVGFDHHFGHNREGSIGKIMESSRKHKFRVEQVDALSTDGKKISSTLIRNLLAEGNIEEANRLLEYPYPLTGTVVGGSRLGRAIGYPTANIQPDEALKMIPGDGVYAITATIGNEVRKGMLNIGFRPTVAKESPTRIIEAHLFDFHQDLYGKKLTLAFYKRLRNEFCFEGVIELKQQLEIDEVQARQSLSGITLENEESND